MTKDTILINGVETMTNDPIKIMDSEGNSLIELGDRMWASSMRQHMVVCRNEASGNHYVCITERHDGKPARRKFIKVADERSGWAYIEKSIR